MFLTNRTRYRIFERPNVRKVDKMLYNMLKVCLNRWNIENINNFGKTVQHF